MLMFTFERSLLPLKENKPFAELFQLPPRYTERHDLHGTHPLVLFRSFDPPAQHPADLVEHFGPFTVGALTDQVVFWHYSQINKATENRELLVDAGLLWPLAPVGRVGQDRKSQYAPL